MCDNKAQCCPAQCCVAKIGKAAPDFKGSAVLPSLEFGDIELAQFKGKWLVLFSYPLLIIENIYKALILLL